MTDSPNAEQHPIVQALRALDPEAIAEVLDFRGELTLVVPCPKLRATAEYLRAEPSMEFAFLSDISAVDWYPMEPRFELNYHLMSVSSRQVLRLRVHVPGGTHPSIETITPVWPTANWHEREIFDLFGIHFDGHPDLHRILMPDDWEGYPLRKDYPTEGPR